MKILYNHRTQGRGAESTHIVSIVKALEQLGHEVDVLSPPGVDPLKSHGQAPVDKAKVKLNGIGKLWSLVSNNLPNFVFELLEIAYNVPVYFRMGKMLREGSYDLIYERYAFFMVAGVLQAKKHKIPFVLEVNEVSGIEGRARPQVFKKICDGFERVLLKRLTSAMPVSSTLKNMLIENGCPSEKIHIQPNAINPQDISIAVDKQNQVLEKIGANGSLLIGCAGWFDKWDRLDFLLESFSQLAKKHERIKLVVIGDGPVLQELRNKAIYIENQSKIIITGAVPRSDIYTYLSVLDIAVLPHSNNFGSPVILFELMGLGRAIVAPKLPPINDVVVDDDIALTFKPLNQVEFVEKIDSLISNNELRAEKGRAAYEKVVSQYTWVENVKNILKSTGHIN